ncbi:MAG: LysM peptidoglycan-binding domain-containing protein [Chloroflexi bacterium]|nr:LysM peptidoglycan-binding domain-containing protein [Chloroflexota bacterium]
MKPLMRKLVTLKPVLQIWRWIVVAAMILNPAAVLAASPNSANAQEGCPGNLLVNPGFEGGRYKTENIGTSLSSAVGNGWAPWAIRGNEVINREPEFKIENGTVDPTRYRVYGGWFAQKYFTTWGTHTAGVYQRVAVPKDQQVEFSIWVQAYTGQRELYNSKGQFISDLQRPMSSEENGVTGPGNYRVYVGIDPTGNVPAGFGVDAPGTVVWSEPRIDRDFRTTDAGGNPVDGWIQLRISAVSPSGFVTVYTKGQPEFSVKHNDSFWDDACLQTGGSARGPAVPLGPAAPMLIANTPSTAAPASPVVAAPKCSTYTVVSGDTLSLIAARQGVSWGKIASDNHLANPNLIFPGNQLNICQ